MKPPKPTYRRPPRKCRFAAEPLEARLMLAADVVISEIMYHPFSPANPSAAAEGEEYIELFNKGNAAANLTGWQLDRGIDYTFSGGSWAGEWGVSDDSGGE